MTALAQSFVIVCVLLQTVECSLNYDSVNVSGVVKYTQPHQKTSGGVTRLRKLLNSSKAPDNNTTYSKSGYFRNLTENGRITSDEARDRALALQQYRVNRNIHTRNLISYGSVSGGTTDTQKGKDSIHIAGFFPTSSLLNISSEGAIGRGVLPAVKLAIYHININNTTLPDYKLHISWNDTKVCDLLLFL